MRHILDKKTPGWLLLLAALIWVAGAGCSDKKKRPSPSASPGAGTAAGGAAATPAGAGGVAGPIGDAAADSALADTYIYTPVGKRDPFKSFYKDVEGKKQEFAGPLGPLQRYEIDQLKLVAVVSGIAQPRAMVTAPDGKGYTVKIGTRIGKNFGRVVRIKTSEVIIAEDYRDWNGRKVTNYIHMSLKKDEKK